MKHDEVDLRVLQDIEKHGWADIGVFPTENAPCQPFNYTVGMVEYSHPDIIVVGLPNTQGHQVLGSAVAKIIADGTTFRPDSYYDHVLQNYRVAFVEVLDIHDPTYPLSMASRLFGHIRAVQLVWPDPEDRFPWHTGYALNKTRQVLLGPWKGSE